MESSSEGGRLVLRENVGGTETGMVSGSSRMYTEWRQAMIILVCVGTDDHLKY